MSSLPYISDDCVAALAIPPATLRAALARAFRLHGAGTTRVAPKLMLPIGPGHFFQSLCAASGDLGYAAHKWVGVAAGNAGRNLATVNSLVTLSAFDTGVPLASLAGNTLTVLRTAAMSGLAAEYLARPDSRSIGFLGCGLQARGHLDALRDVLPGLRNAVCVSGGPASAERLAAAARSMGLEAHVSGDPADALACDVVVTSVRAGAASPVLDAGLLRPGSFTTAVDLGTPFRPDTLRALDILATDDRAQSDEPTTRARLPITGPFDADLAELVGGTAPGRASARQRAMFLFPGYPLADLAIAAAIYEAAGRRAGTVMARFLRRAGR